MRDDDEPRVESVGRAPLPDVPHVRFDARPTVQLDPRDLKPSWPIVIASLEQLSDWSVFALRLGTLALIQSCVRDLAHTNARADLVVRLRALTDALALMPLE
jgi:hypothetical protein